jgi:hypothetical protein
VTECSQAAKDAIHGHLKQVKQRFSKDVLNRKGLGGMYIDYAETSAKALNEVCNLNNSGLCLRCGAQTRLSIFADISNTE